MSKLRERYRSAKLFFRTRAIKAYSQKRLIQEIAFIAYYFHWSRKEIIELSHLERIQWCNTISEFHKEGSTEPRNVFKDFT